MRAWSSISRLCTYRPFARRADATISEPYKNGYDLGQYRIGEPPPGKSLKSREIVDRALPLQNGQKPNDVYFGAIELNGAGIRFYGDVCLGQRFRGWRPSLFGDLASL